MANTLKTIGYCTYTVTDFNHPEKSKIYIIKFRNKDVAKQKALESPDYQYMAKTELVRAYGAKIAEQTRSDTIHELDDVVDFNTEPYVYLNK